MLKMNKNIRPGNGWVQLSPSVFEYTDGTRIHLLGLVKLINGTSLHTHQFPDSVEAYSLILANGGNRKRGMMAWARLRSEQLTCTS